MATCEYMPSLFNHTIYPGCNIFLHRRSECLLQYFWPALSDNRSLSPFLSIFEWPLKGLVNLKKTFLKLSMIQMTVTRKPKCWKPHLKIPTESKVMQVLKLCKLAYNSHPHYCFEMIFSKCHILCSVISTQLKTAQLSFYMYLSYWIIFSI